MKFLKRMQGVRTRFGHYACLLRDEGGRLVVAGDCVDLLDLLRWVDENPLTQFREITKEQSDSEPHWLFAQLFDENGKLKPATTKENQDVA